ncbi:DUF4394 domain-containing protein [Pelagibacterium montanilacus]|uniref:DUF4394 domain-containing protein n=1 Tax=Pelagibacterium montanilacus TaxID=2185280 RepID=UPI000F8ECDAF|nr:DUF4394 domain-containing protein [Pelagibacterium montanilacus]
MSFAILTRIALAGVGTIALAGAAHANSAVGLIGDRTLVMFNTETLMVDGMMDVTGVDRLHGIDVRPADGWVYGVDSENNIVTIDLDSGEATVSSTITESIGDGAMPSVDFNPVADRLRFMGSDGTNLRINVETGETIVDGSLQFDEAGDNAGDAHNVVATAYTNSVGSPEATAMYDIDMDMLALLQQTAPNDGTLAVIGELGIDSAESIAWDIYAEDVDMNTAYLAVGTVLYTVDLESGMATEWGPIEGLDAPLRDMTVLPAEM